jgi:hypothetical protein
MLQQRMYQKKLNAGIYNAHNRSISYTQQTTEIILLTNILPHA